MNGQNETVTRVRQIVLQRLESLQRAGVSDLPRRDVPNSSLAISQDANEMSDHAAVPKFGGGERNGEEETEIIGSLPTAMALTTSSAQSASPLPSAGKDHEKADPSSVGESMTGRSGTAKRSDPASEKRVAALAAMQIEVAACRRCEHLACTRNQTVFGVGNPHTRLCFMGEAPGADEDRLGEPFVGRAGQLLTDIIQKGMKLQRSDVYILNVLKCRPPENRVPTDEEIANCREYFERQLELLKPEFICCLGATAARSLLNTKQALGRMRGQWFDYRGSRVMVTYHPSYLLRNPPAKKDTWEDIQMLMREMGLPIGKMS